MPMDTPEDIKRVKAGPMLGSNAKIGPQPEPSRSRKALEMLTGYPADPMREMNPMDGLQMLSTGLMIPGAIKGLKAGGSALINAARSRGAVPSAVRGIGTGSIPKQSAAQDMMNPRSLDMMKRMGDDSNAKLASIGDKWQQRGPDLRTFGDQSPEAKARLQDWVRTPHEMPSTPASREWARNYRPPDFDQWAGWEKIKEAVGNVGW